MRRALNPLFGLGLVSLGLVALAAAPASAQAIETATAVPGVGWTVTPSVLANTTWDDNPLVRGRGDLAPKDLVNVLNPRLVILGGTFARLHPLVAGAIDANLARYALPGLRSLVRVVPASLGDDAPLIGAAELAFEGLLSDPAAWFEGRDRAFHLASA